MPLSAPSAPRRPAPAGRGPLAWIRNRLRNRPDSEHEISLNRFVIGTVLLVFAIASDHLTPGADHAMLEETAAFFVVFYLAAIVIFVHILLYPGISPTRRVLSAALDIGMVSYAAVAAGPDVGFFYPVFLWAIFGNGFRFGLPYLYITMGISLVCFSAVLYATGYWLTNPGFSLALALTLLILPLYASLLIRKLREAKRQAEEASRAKSLFLASVSHELRTPLNAIIGLSDLLDDQEWNRPEAEMIGAIGRSGRLLLEMIDELLNFSRLEAGRMPTSTGDVDLYDLLARVRGMLQVQADRNGIALGATVAPGVPRKVHADGRHLEEILVNLASNAVKFTSDGSVTMLVEPVDGRDGWVRFEVTDTGIGVAPSAQQRIFESFTQADETIIDRFGGTGLGLAICKQLVELMGGQIGICSELGKGSTLWFELPLTALPEEAAPETELLPLVVATRDAALAETARAVAPGATVLAEDSLPTAFEVASRHRPAVVLLDATEDLPAFPPSGVAVVEAGPGTEDLSLADRAGRVAARLATPAGPAEIRSALTIASVLLSGAGRTGSSSLDAINDRHLRVLVAEDNRTNQMVITKILERAGHSVTIAENGEEAVDLLREGAFDIVLMDINMPVMNGIEATKLYRFASLGQRRIPIVALTADATGKARDRCLEAGMDACATKPIEARELLRLIGEMTAHADGEPAAADEVVVGIASHPAFATGAGGALKTATLDDLEALGGPEFVGALADQFLVDAERLLHELETAVGQSDENAFREITHAMRSAAANVGAQSIFETCLAWRRITREELATDGVQRLDELRDKLTATRGLLEAYFEERSGSRAAAG